MTGQDIQARLDAIVTDLQTTHKGKSVDILVRAEDNTSAIRTLSSDADGVVNAVQLAAIQDFIDNLKPVADTYEAEFAPVKVASETYRLARAEHQVLIDAAQAARIALQDALTADADYQAADTALKALQADVDYVNARSNYQMFNVSENFGNISDARGKYY